MELFFREMGQGPAVVILHGLFGSSDNWQSFAKELAGRGYRVATVDLRNHGQSPHDSGFNYDLMSEDVAGLIRSNFTEPVWLIGHSMGGKTAMTLAAAHPGLLKGIVIIDIAPRYYQPHHQTILAALRSFEPSLLASRGEAERLLSEKIQDLSTRQFLLKNLFWKEKDQLAWRFNLDAIEHHIEEVGKDTYPENPVTLPALFIAGERSGYIADQDRSEILVHFPAAKLAVAPQAGHWVHADQPAWLLDTVETFIAK